MLRPCGRRLCTCVREILPLYVHLPLNEKERQLNASKIEKMKKNYKGCYGSYKVMVANLEKVPEYRKF